MFSNIPLDGPVVIFDLEWTAWERSQEQNWSDSYQEREIVEIGAVKLDGSDGLKETITFELLVRPTINPILSQYFTNLTGITQTILDNEAVSFRDALTLFEGFVGYDEKIPILCLSQDAGVLRHNCELNQILCPFKTERFYNVLPEIAAASGRDLSSFSSSNLPEIFDFPPPANAHRALGDARCIAESLRLLSGFSSETRH